jgi:D-alanyl-D-alanine dipeptidase
MPQIQVNARLSATCLRYYVAVTRTSYVLLFVISVASSSMILAQTKQQPVKTKPPRPTSVHIIPGAYRELLANAAEAIVVTTSGWNSVDGTLVRYEKSDGKWHQVGDTVETVVGKNGLGVDGVMELSSTAGQPVKKEGDGRSPAGIFAIGEAFGFAPSAPDLKLPYRPLVDSIECVDDASSSSYNEIVDRQQIANPDWNSSEKMRSIDVYKEGAVVKYNDQRFAGAGSCIFLHIWKAPGRGTAGCTAMPEDKLKELLGWLDAAKKPVLVQLPEPVYKQLKSSWNLP